MKRTILLAAMAACLFATNVLVQKIEGNDIYLPLIQTGAGDFMNKSRAAKITVIGGGSGVGIPALMEGTTNMTVASRKMEFDERTGLQEVGKKTKEEVTVYDALIVAVYLSNKVSNLTRKQSRDIFTDKIESWKEVDGTDVKIVAYSRETPSRTYELFKGSVLKDKNYMSGISSIPATGTVIQSVSRTKRATGYVGLACLSKEVKPIHVSYDTGESYVEPSLENARNKTCPVIHSLLYCHKTKNASKVRPFIGYVMSVEGQATVGKVGYIPVE